MCQTYQLQKLYCSAQHATIGAPWTNGLLSLLNKELGRNVAIHKIVKGSVFYQALDDHLLLAKLVADSPTRID